MFGVWTGVVGGVGLALDERMVAWFAFSFVAILVLGGANVIFRLLK